MNKTNYASNPMPTANIAVNKSRIKLYEKGVDMPTYYLQKGQEFQIEIFNPTSDVILAKITLNNKLISQGGLVINPGQRVFLDRYLDVAKKFLFDTYEVSNTKEVQKAIESNGDIKVEFYRENKPKPYFNPFLSTGSSTVTIRDFNVNDYGLGNYNIGTDPQFLRGSLTSGSIINTGVNDSVNYNSTLSNSNITTSSYSSNNNLKTLGQLDMNSLSDEVVIKRSPIRSKKMLETGRVEAGSHSSQEFKYVNKSFDYSPFWTVKYKLLPVSQKVNTVDDINVKVYCTNCGAKLGKTDRFCSSCGTKK